jgi:glycosyltransferase involved in cell wall biosynthesis
LADDEFIVLQLGRMVPRKGVDNVIRAIAQLDPAVPARLLVVGGESAEPDERATPEIGRLRRVARECGVGDKVTFLGHRQRDELRAYYAACDVFVTTPWYEPFGITPLEAMACGRPVIGSTVGGIQYSVVHGVTGFLVPPHDPAALAAGLATLHGNPALANARGAHRPPSQPRSTSGSPRMSRRAAPKPVLSPVEGANSGVRSTEVAK